MNGRGAAPWRKGLAVEETRQKAAFGLDPKKQKIVIAALAAVFLLFAGRVVWRKATRARPSSAPGPAVTGTDLVVGDPVKILAELRERPSLRPDRWSSSGGQAEREPLSRNPFGISARFREVILGPSPEPEPGAAEAEGPDPEEEAPPGLVLHAILADKDQSIALVNDTYLRKGDEIRAEQLGQPMAFRVEAIEERAVILRQLGAKNKGIMFVLRLEPPRFKGRVQ